jgi:molybdopterin-guanine dinucleotide biosynthesis protein B
MAGIMGFCACRSNTGKTTLLLNILQEMRRRGVETAVLKHGRHWEIDASKDSSRYASAATAGSLFVSPHGWTLEAHTEQEISLEKAAELLRAVTGCELVLAEGYKNAPIPKIAVCRSGVCLELPCKEEELAAVVSDVPLPVVLPQFRFDDISGICDFVLSEAGRQSSSAVIHNNT